METPYIYLNGTIMPADEAAISPYDVGLLRGYAVFDLLRTVGGKPFMLAEHLKRLRSSAEHLNLAVPATDSEIVEAIRELLCLNDHDEATVRLVLTGGTSPDGMGYDPKTPTFFILTHDLKELPAAVYEHGGKLLTHRHHREVPEAKTTNYITMLKHRSRVGDEGALDLLYHDGQRVTEAASASVYFVRGSTILAPKDSVLWGTIGSYVLNLAEERYEVVLCDISLEEALGADEAFLTSTTRGVVPIVALDDARVGDGRVGPVVRYLMARYRAAAFGE